MKMRSIDVLLLARPDHSLQIYDALEKQDSLKFHFLSFRVFKKWLKFLCVPKVSYVGKNATVLVSLTLRHILKYNFKKSTYLDERAYFEKGTYNILKKYKPTIIHYWPSYCSNVIKEYKKEHSEVITIAEQYMPNPVCVLEIMKPVYEKYGLEFNNAYLKRYVKNILLHFDGADYICVPSKYVEDTMRKTFPNHKYLHTPYGISIASDYEYKLKTDKVKRFVYVGGVSLEKGVDVILGYFSKRPDLELHLFGTINKKQKVVFDVYNQCYNIVFHGAVSKETLREQFKRMDVGIHPSRFDAYSLAVGEEIGSGLPVIVSDHTGNFSDIQQFGWGKVYETENLMALDEAVRAMENQEQYNYYKKMIDKYVKESSRNTYGALVMNIYKLLKNDVKTTI